MHSHDHSGHHHHHNESTNIAWAFFLNLGFTVIELIGGVLTNSTAIMADAVHDLGDSLAIGLAWFLSRLGKRPSDESFTYGYRRFSLLGAVVNGIVLVIGFRRMHDTADVFQFCLFFQFGSDILKHLLVLAEDISF